MRNEQVAMSPGHGCAARGAAHLLMVEGRERSELSGSEEGRFARPSTALRAVPLPCKGRGGS
jgi:hypothetical protein